jgi:phosphoglycolate phosphatase-like HAD superfamily hydrolase
MEMKMRPCYLFDIDGTIANGDHRLHHIQKKPKDWDAYFEACSEDKPIRHVIDIAMALNSAGHHIVLVTGRSAVVKDKTLFWLDRYMPFHDVFYMRSVGDHKDDDKLKMEFLAQMRADGWEPVMAFDDRSRVVKSWREAGIPCAQVAEGDF